MRYLLFISALFLLSSMASATDYTYGSLDTSSAPLHVTITGGWAQGSLFSVTATASLDSGTIIVDDACTDCELRLAVYRESDDVLMDSCASRSFNFSGGNDTIKVPFVLGTELSASTDYYWLAQAPVTAGDALVLRMTLPDGDPVRRSDGQGAEAWDDPATTADVSSRRMAGLIYLSDDPATGKVIMITGD